MKRLPIIIILSALVALFSARAYPQDMPPAKVRVASVTAEQVAMTNPFTGTVDFERLSEVSPEVPGKVVFLDMNEGSFVKQGDVLLTVDTALLMSSADVLRSQIAEKAVKLEDSEKRLGRARGLYDRGIISQQDYDGEYYTNRTLATEADTLKSQLARIELEIEKSTLRAPFDGIVMEKKTDVGQWVKPDGPVCTMASTREVYVRVAVPEDIVRFVATGQKVAIRMDALGREFEGTVAGIVPVAEVRSRNFDIKVRVPWSASMVRNMSAVVHVPVSPKMDLRLIMRDALVSFGGKDMVYTIKDGKAAVLPVNIVAYLGERVGVDNPYIVPGMPVVVEGNERLMPDSPVEVVGGN